MRKADPIMAIRGQMTILEKSTAKNDSLLADEARRNMINRTPSTAVSADR